jgi:hypothetical protein
MDDATRRDALRLAAVAAAAVAVTGAAAGDDKDKPKPMTDRDRVLACGLTPDEADCWGLAAELAGKFFALPKLHEMDNHEVAHAIHVIQHKLLSRPVYRRYLELARNPKP